MGCHVTVKVPARKRRVCPSPGAARTEILEVLLEDPKDKEELMT